MPATIFDKPIFPGARIVTVEVEVSNVSGSYTNTVQDNRISASMEANSIEIDDPSVFRDKITVTSYNGSFVISCPSVEGETTARISFLKIMDDQQVINSHEYDELNNNIGDLEDLETTDQSSVVNAINEVIDNKPDYATEMPMSDSDSTSVSQAIANLNTNLQKKAEQSSTGWGTSVSCDLKGSQAIVIINGAGLFTIWFGGTVDINVYRIPSTGASAYTKTGQNSVTFGMGSETGTDITATRNGNTLTITRTTNSTIKIFT